jgi:hypothetical protein
MLNPRGLKLTRHQQIGGPNVSRPGFTFGPMDRHQQRASFSINNASSGPGSSMKAWIRQALTFGGVSASITLVSKLLGTFIATETGCIKQSRLDSLSFVGFLVMMAMAGFMTTRAGGNARQASLAGLVAAAISGASLLLAVTIVVAVADVSQCASEDPGLAWLLDAAIMLITAIVTSAVGVGVGVALATVGGNFGLPGRIAASAPQGGNTPKSTSL